MTIRRRGPGPETDRQCIWISEHVSVEDYDETDDQRRKAEAALSLLLFLFPDLALWLPRQDDAPPAEQPFQKLGEKFPGP